MPSQIENLEEVAKEFHETCERIYKGSASPWEEVTPQYQALLKNTLTELIEKGIITIGSERLSSGPQGEDEDETHKNQTHSL